MSNYDGSDRANERTSIVRQWIADELKRCSSFHYRFTRRLNQYNEEGIPGELSYSEKNGEMYYSERWTEDGVRKTRYLGKSDSKEVQKAQEMRFLGSALDELDKHTARLGKFASAFTRFDPAEVNSKLPKAYRLSEAALRTVTGLDEEEKWYREALRDKEISERRLSDFFKSGRKHSAKDGTLVRSKSEVSIANALFDRGIKYIYESPLTVNNVPMHPDFVFYSYSRGRVIYWEHVGMLGDEDYRAEFADRVSQYIKGGFVPCVDVIFTFDTWDGNIDSAMIEAIIDEYM